MTDTSKFLLSNAHVSEAQAIDFMRSEHGMKRGKKDIEQPRTTPRSLTQKWVDDEAPLANQNDKTALPKICGDADEQIGWVKP